MKLTQLSIFIENKPGHMLAPFRLLADGGINVRAISVSDTQRFGILRMVVSDCEKAAKILEDSGFAVKLTEVVAVEVPDQPGGLAKALAVLEGTSINIEYMYALPFGRGENAALVFRFNDPDAAIARFKSAGMSVVAHQQL